MGIIKMQTVNKMELINIGFKVCNNAFRELHMLVTFFKF